MDLGSVRRNGKPKERVVAIAVIVRSVVISITVIGVPRIRVIVSVESLVFVNTLMVTSVGLFVHTTVAGPIVDIPCLRRRPPSDQKHCQKSDYYNLSNVFHFHPPFITINRMNNEKGYTLIKKFYPALSQDIAARP
jgi:hypothetical protein